MQRTQIYLEPEMSAALDRLARKRHTTRANLLRLAARRFLQQEGLDGEDPIFGIIGIGRSGIRHGSVEHDRLMAEDEIKSWSR
jgi:hypothetical protein